MRLSLIVAMAEDRVIGRAGDLPWRLSADLRRFKRLTMNHHVVMGRKTYESIGRPLPGRRMIVITRRPDYAAPEVEVAAGLDAALSACAGDDEAFIIGGAEIYRQALPLVDRIYLTLVHAAVDGDVQFPAVDWSAWRLAEDARHAADDKNHYDYSFQVYNRGQA